MSRKAILTPSQAEVVLHRGLLDEQGLQEGNKGPSPGISQVSMNE